MINNGQGGGLGEPAFTQATDEPLSGTGGGAGGGTRSGSGDPSGANLEQNDAESGSRDGPTLAAAGELAGRTDDEVAQEAAALGPADGSLADASGQRGGAGPTIGESVGATGAREVGSGTGGDRGELGGGGSTGGV